MDEGLKFYLKRHSEVCVCDDLKLSYQEIVTELNTSREVISRLIKNLEHRVVVKFATHYYCTFKINLPM